MARPMTGEMPGAHDLLGARAVDVRAGERVLVRELTFGIRPGEFIALLGRNGSGKSLTLHTLAGLRAAAAGDVVLGGTSMGAQPRKAVAQQLGLLLQDLESAYATTAMESVLIGRHPHLGAWQWERPADRDIAAQALARVGLGDAAARSTSTLSGGEQRRVAMAALLAQRPRVFLLDEPTNHLDPHHQFDMLDAFRDLTRQGHAVLATLHDPTIAARYSDRVVLLFGDGRWRAGATRDVLTAENLSEVYLTRIVEARIEGRKVFVAA